VLHPTTSVRNGSGAPAGFSDPPPLSGNLDDIVAYMQYIGEARRRGADRPGR
jgi:hypothetical protein